MSHIKNKKALITGGASGIGKLMGKLLLQKGLHTLVIWDVNENLLHSTTNELTQQGFKVLPYVVVECNKFSDLKTIAAKGFAHACYLGCERKFITLHYKRINTTGVQSIALRCSGV